MLLFMYWSRYREGGQGIVEYAMIMAFVLSIGLCLYQSGIQGAVGDIITDVVELFTAMH